jgi:sec-independent protein translocase protein TatA
VRADGAQYTATGATRPLSRQGRSQQMMPGPMEMVVVLVIALVVFGPKRLPELGKSLGSGMRSFKDSVSGEDEHEEPVLPRKT